MIVPFNVHFSVDIFDVESMKKYNLFFFFSAGIRKLQIVYNCSKRAV